MTRRDELDNVLGGIDAAKKAGFNPVKINAVVERGANDDEIVDLARFGRDNGLEVRFIEFMPLDAEQGWSNSKVVSQDEIVARIAEAFPLEQVPQRGAARVFSQRANSTRARCGATVPATTPSPTKFEPPSAPSGPATKSAKSPSCAPRAQ